MADIDELHRFVLLDGVLTPDPARRLPGRGAWLHADPQCLIGARAGFSRSLRTSVEVCGLVDWLEMEGLDRS